MLTPAQFKNIDALLKPIFTEEQIIQYVIIKIGIIEETNKQRLDELEASIPNDYDLEQYK